MSDRPLHSDQDCLLSPDQGADDPPGRVPLEDKKAGLTLQPLLLVEGVR